MRCADGDLVLAIGNDRQFAALCEVLPAPEVAGDPKFATNAARAEHRTRLRQQLEGRLAALPASYWATTLTEARVPAGVVNDVAGAFSDLGLAPVISLARADGTTVEVTRNPDRPVNDSADIPVRTTAPVTTFTAPAARLRGTALAVALVGSLATVTVSHTGTFPAWDSSATVTKYSS